MSVGAKTSYEQALALVHRGTVRGETVLPCAGWSRATLASDESHHQNGRPRCLGIGAAPFDANETLPDPLPARGRCVESP